MADSLMRDFRHHASDRWSRAIIRAIDAQEDPRTLRLWADVAGTSVGALRTWCRAARVSSRQSLYFARMLRALVRLRGKLWDPLNVLDIVDDRTLAAFLRRCGLHGQSAPTLDLFLRTQTLVLDDSNKLAIVDQLRRRNIDVGGVAPGDMNSERITS